MNSVTNKKYLVMHFREGTQYFLQDIPVGIAFNHPRQIFTAGDDPTSMSRKH